jgi:pyruvate dehydrogenase E2 component (dihydrolipoamide acetyltransferase)
MSEPDTKHIPLSRIQKLIGRRMLESKQTQPCFYVTARGDISKINEIRRPMSKELGARISMNDFFIRAMAMAIEKYPLMRGLFKDDYIEIPDDINIGLAVAAPNGLVVPAVKNANLKNIVEIAKDTTQLIEKAKAGKLNLDDLTGVSMTLTALGMFGIDSFLAIPSQGQCGIVSVGKITEQPVPYQDRIEIKKFVEFGLACDNRIASPDYAAEFLMEIINLIANPQEPRYIGIKQN